MKIKQTHKKTTVSIVSTLVILPPKNRCDSRNKDIRILVSLNNRIYVFVFL